MQLTDRNILILKIIIEEYLQTGELLGSKLLLSKYNIGVSPATVRGDMAKLEKLNLIFQPYNSAGRLPTSQGLRVYVDYIMKETPSYFLNEENINLKNNIQNFSDYIYNKIKTLSINTSEISFFALPKQNILEYSGINLFLQNSKNKIEESIKIIEMIEDKIRFLDFLNKLNLNNGIKLFIGEENSLMYLKNFSIIIKPINVNNEKGYIGLIGNVSQNYSYNIATLKGII